MTSSIRRILIFIEDVLTKIRDNVSFKVVRLQYFSIRQFEQRNQAEVKWLSCTLELRPDLLCSNLD